MITREVLSQEKQEYNSVVNHPLQSWQWGEFREKTGIEVLRLGEFEGKTLKNAYQITIHKLPKLPFSIAYLPKGPKPTKEMIESLRKVAKQKNIIFVKLEPNLIVKDDSFEKEAAKLGLIKGKPFFTKHTFYIDLTLSDEDLLKNMKPKTRYNLRLSEKHQVKVVEDNSDKAFENYLELMMETTKRQGFFAHSKDYHRRMWETLKKDKMAHLLVASKDGVPLVTWILFRFKDFLYYPYGASTRDQKNTMASYAMMWSAIQFGKKNSCKTFDLWGTLGPNPDKNDPWYGFHRFKEGFGPKMVEFAGTYDLVTSPTLYSFYKITDQIRWRLLRIKAKLPF